MKQALLILALAACGDDGDCEIDLSTGRCVGETRCEQAVGNYYDGGCIIGGDSRGGATFDCEAAEGRLIGSACEDEFESWRTCLVVVSQCGCTDERAAWMTCESP